MAIYYQSQYSGQEVDTGVGKGTTSLQQDQLTQSISATSPSQQKIPTEYAVAQQLNPIKTELNEKAPKSTTYTKTETNDLLDTKLDKITEVTDNDKVYIKKADGTQDSINISNEHKENSIVKTDENGRILQADIDSNSPNEAVVNKSTFTNAIKKIARVSPTVEQTIGTELTLKDTSSDQIVKPNYYGVSNQHISANLIPQPYKNKSNVINGVTWKINSDYSVTASGTATSRSVFYLFSDSSSPILSNVNLFLSGCPSNGSLNTYWNEIHTYTDGADGYVSDIGSGVLVPVNKNIVGVYLVVQNGYTANNLTFYPMLNAGTEALPYDPYTGQPSPDNPIDIISAGDKQSDNTYKFDIKSEGINLFDPTKYDGLDINLKAGTKLRVQGTYENMPAPNDYTEILFFYNTDGTTRSLKLVDYTIIGKTNYNKTIELDKDCNKCAFRRPNQESNVCMTLSYNEIGYVPYSSATYNFNLQDQMRSIDDVRDSLTSEGKLIKRIAYKEFDGTEGWSLEQITSSSGSYYRFAWYEYQMIGAITKSGFRCNKFDYEMLNQVNGIWGSEIAPRMWFGLSLDGNIATVEQWKSQLATWKTNGTPLYAIYELATPTETQLAEELPEIQLQDEQTTLSAEVQIGLTNEYLTDIKVRGDLKDSDNRTILLYNETSSIYNVADNEYLNVTLEKLVGRKLVAGDNISLSVADDGKVTVGTTATKLYKHYVISSVVYDEVTYDLKIYYILNFSNAITKLNQSFISMSGEFTNGTSTYIILTNQVALFAGYVRGLKGTSTFESIALKISSATVTNDTVTEV